jgi:hypothetical protein
MPYPLRSAPGCYHGRDVAEEVRVAAHESAHALMRYEHAKNIDLATITRQVVEDGNIVNGRVSGPSYDFADDPDYFDRLIEAVAGDCGEGQYLGECRGLGGSDRQTAERCASALADSPKARKLLISAARVEATRIINENWIAFERLINALLVQRTLGGVEVEAIIRRSSPRK